MTDYYTRNELTETLHALAQKNQKMLDFFGE